MQEQEREWKASIEASIREKEARSKKILQEKEAQKKHVSSHCCWIRLMVSYMYTALL